jgi:hypothetical protein
MRERRNAETTRYTWDFGDGTTASGDSVTHTYTDPGSYVVELTVQDFYGTTSTTTQDITVAEHPTATETATPSATNTESDLTPTSDASTLRFGVGTALAEVLGGGYLLRDRLPTEDSDWPQHTLNEVVAPEGPPIHNSIPLNYSAVSLQSR